MIVRREIRINNPSGHPSDRSGGVVDLKRLDRPDQEPDREKEFRLELNREYFIALSRDELAAVVAAATQLLNGAVD